MGNTTIEVGYFKNAGKPEGGGPLSIAQIAAVQEFGTDDGHIPARPFLRMAFDNNFMENMKLANVLHSKVIDGKLDPFQMVMQMGLKMVNDIKLTITDLKTPPNAPTTVVAKGFDNPLIETGSMRNATAYRIKIS